jgi:hypothetical protein
MADLNTAFRQIITQRAALEGPSAYQMELDAIARGDAARALLSTVHGNDQLYYASSGQDQPTSPGIGFDIAGTPFVTWVLLAVGAYLLFGKKK